MEKSWRRRALDILLIAALTVVVYFAVEKLFFLLFPMAAALVFSEAIRKSFHRLHPLSPVVKRILIVLILLIFFALLSLMVILLVDRLIHGVSALSSGLSEEIGRLTEFCQESIRSFEGMISRLLKRDMENSLTSRLPALFEQLMQKILASVPNWVATMVAWIPRFFLSLLIFIIATYYFSCDWKRLSRVFSRHIKKETLEGIRSTKDRMLRGLAQYGKAYLLLFLLTFSLLFLGLSLLRIPGSPGKAILIAMVDILPIFGCGTVLIPWSVISLLTGNTAQGIGLVILYLVIFVLRQILEPKIVGDSIGLHPLLSLVLVICGLSLFGIFGMILFPLIGTCVVEGLRDGGKTKKASQ